MPKIVFFLAIFRKLSTRTVGAWAWFHGIWTWGAKVLVISFVLVPTLLFVISTGTIQSPMLIISTWQRRDQF